MRIYKIQKYRFPFGLLGLRVSFLLALILFYFGVQASATTRGEAIDAGGAFCSSHLHNNSTYVTIY